MFTCLVKSWIMLCSDTWEPMAKRLFNCFSMREIISWSSCVVKPSTPEKHFAINTWLLLICSNSRHYPTPVQCLSLIPDRLPDSAASSVDTWKRRRASSTSSSPAIACSFILAKDSEIRTTASNCLYTHKKRNLKNNTVGSRLKLHCG